MNPWMFYGRTREKAALSEMFRRNRFFFAKMTGRRRIGKTSLVQQVLRASSEKKQVFYAQIPDSEPTGVISAINDALDTFHIPAEIFPRPRGISQLVRLIESLIRAGYVVVLDEFQYFSRKGYTEFCSLLQAAVDRLNDDSAEIRGGLMVLGSLYTEMVALLEDRTAPLFNRVTDTFELSHLDISTVVEILDEHGEATAERLLFLWNLFEGVPKFYRDCYERGVLVADRKSLIRKMFFESSSPLRTEADNWFLRELRGRYDLVLKSIARRPGRTHRDLVSVIRETSGNSSTQVGGYLKVLMERFRLVEKRLPIFSKPNARKGRYYLTDNFLRTWLAALANPVSALAFRPLDQLLEEADRRLQESEGPGLEKLVGQLYEERSRMGIGDFSLTQRINGFWDRSDVEIDLVAVNEEERRIRFGSCKRSPSKLIADINNFKSHVERFLELKPSYKGWSIELAGISPVLDKTQRHILLEHQIMAQDIHDLVSV